MTEQIRLDEWLAEIDRIAPKQHHNTTLWTDAMDKALLTAREKGVSWEKLSALAESWGWPSHNRLTLVKRYRQLTGAT